LQLAINKNPNIPLALLKLSELRVNQSRYTEAKTYLDQYVKLAPLSPNVILLQYRTALGLHDNVAAAAAKDIMFKRFPNTPEAQTIKTLVSP
ncbi:hypothetical protein TI04_13735, partial [Achromatium sp. WMS2]